MTSFPHQSLVSETIFPDNFLQIKNFIMQHCFTISYRRENQRQYELKCNTESECSAWIIAIREARYGEVLIKI